MCLLHSQCLYRLFQQTYLSQSRQWLRSRRIPQTAKACPPDRLCTLSQTYMIYQIFSIFPACPLDRLCTLTYLVRFEQEDHLLKQREVALQKKQSRYCGRNELSEKIYGHYYIYYYTWTRAFDILALPKLAYRAHELTLSKSYSALGFHPISALNDKPVLSQVLENSF